MVNKDQSQDLESLGYPKPPESMLNSESVPANILTSYALCFFYGYTAPLMTIVLFIIINQMRLFWLILSRSLSVTYMVQVSGVK